MAKTKAAKPVDSKSSSKETMAKVKDGKVAKVTAPIQAKVDKTTSKKSKRAPTPPSESESESESDSESASGSDDVDDVDSASDDSSESESDDEVVTKSAAPKVNGSAKLTNGHVSSGSESDDEDESDDEAVPPKATKALGAKAAAPPAAEDDDDESDDESDDSSASDESESASESEEKPAAGQKAKAADLDSEEDSEGSSSESSSEDDDEAAPTAAAIAAKKRKADVVETPVAKKSKTETESAGSASLFVGNLSWNVDEEWLSREFSEYGEVIGCRIITDRDSGRSKGFGYVDFANAGDAGKALEAMKGYELDGRALNVDASNPRDKPNDRVNARANKFGDSTSPPSDTLWIGNLPWGSDADSLRQACEEYGAVASVRIPTDRETGEIKGFGYVSFTSIDEAKAAHASLQGADFQGRPMRVDFSGPRPDRDANGFGDARGGGRGGGFRGRGGGRGGGDRGGGGFRGGFRGGRGDSRGGRGGRGVSTNRGGIGDFSGKKVTF